MVDISIIITAHREGVIAGTTARSACQAIERARAEAGLSAEVILVFDNASRDTVDVLEHGFAGFEDATVRRLDVSVGDPGQARNEGIAAATGTASTFLDSDDLWSSNWLVAAHALNQKRPDAVLHSACNVVFGQRRTLWWHVDSEGPLFDERYLAWGNYWDAMSFARTEIYREHLFAPNDLKLGFGHEDWHWAALTYANGIAHKPVPDTLHFKRSRAGSQMSLVDAAGAVVRPLHLKGEPG